MRTPRKEESNFQLQVKSHTIERSRCVFSLTSLWCHLHCTRSKCCAQTPLASEGKWWLLESLCSVAPSVVLCPFSLCSAQKKKSWMMKSKYVMCKLDVHRWFVGNNDHFLFFPASASRLWMITYIIEPQLLPVVESYLSLTKTARSMVCYLDLLLTRPVVPFLATCFERTSLILSLLTSFPVDYLSSSASMRHPENERAFSQYIKS